MDKKPNQPTHYELRGIRGLPKRSLALAEQLHTINKRDIIRYMGHLPPDEIMLGIVIALVLSLLPDGDD